MKAALRFVVMAIALGAAAYAHGRVGSPSSTGRELPGVVDCKNHYILGQPCSPAWTSINRGLTDLDVRVVAVDPVARETLYAGGTRGVFKSVDGGDTWSATGLSMDAVAIADNAAAYAHFVLPSSFDARSTVTHLEIDSADSKTVYAATIAEGSAWFGQRRLYKSVDGGGTWTDSVSPAINGVDNIHSLAMAPSDPATLYLANFDDGTGDSWSPIARTTDGGGTWTYLGYPALSIMAVDPVDPRSVYAGTFAFAPYFTTLPNGVLKSTDGGVTWTPTGLTGTGVTALTIAPGDRRTVFAATTDAWPAAAGPLFRSIDGGATWTEAFVGAGPFIVTAIVVHPADSKRVYVATNGGGVMRSLDGGVTWTALNPGLPSLSVQSLVLIEGEPNTLYAGTSAGVFKITE